MSKIIYGCWGFPGLGTMGPTILQFLRLLTENMLCRYCIVVHAYPSEKSFEHMVTKHAQSIEVLMICSSIKNKGHPMNGMCQNFNKLRVCPTIRISMWFGMLKGRTIQGLTQPQPALDWIQPLSFTAPAEPKFKFWAGLIFEPGWAWILSWFLAAAMMKPTPPTSAAQQNDHFYHSRHWFKS